MKKTLNIFGFHTSIFAMNLKKCSSPMKRNEDGRGMKMEEEKKELEEKRKLFYEAKATGKCRLCGWGDGDGTKVCYYDPELGPMTHENSMEVAMAAMTVSQRNLLESYDSGKHAYISKEMLREDIEKEIKRVYKKIRECEKDIEKFEQELREVRSLEDIKKRGWLYKTYEEFVNLKRRRIEGRKRDITAYKKYIEMQRAEPNAVLDFLIKGEEVVIKNRLTAVENAENEGYFVVYPEQLEKPFMGKLVWVQKPHLCGGFGKFIAPYHIGCTKCAEEVKLWEFGIDYDVG